MQTKLIDTRQSNVKLILFFFWTNISTHFKGSYACLEVQIGLQRDLSSYINEIYIPSSLIVSLSFISFHIDYKSAAARAPLGATSVLTITTMLGGKKQIKITKLLNKKAFQHNND